MVDDIVRVFKIVWKATVWFVTQKLAGSDPPLSSITAPVFESGFDAFNEGPLDG